MISHSFDSEISSSPKYILKNVVLGYVNVYLNIPVKEHSPYQGTASLSTPLEKKYTLFSSLQHVTAVEEYFVHGVHNVLQFSRLAKAKTKKQTKHSPPSPPN